MDKSLIFLHPEDRILASNDGQVFVKSGSEWKATTATLYKSEKTYPTTEGIANDYYAKYLKKFNHFIYSEDFTQDVWNKTNIGLNSEPSIVFPKSSVTKITPTKTSKKHSMTYCFTNDRKSYMTFSLYVKPNELKRIKLGLSDFKETYSVEASFNFSDETYKTHYSSSGGAITSAKTRIQPIQINYVDGSFFKYYRVWLTTKFPKALRVNAYITLLDNDGNEEFIPDDVSHGLFINGAQLVMDDVPEDYIDTDGEFKSSLYLEHLYRKMDDSWEIIDNNLIYADLDDDISSLGEDGDVLVTGGLVKIGPAMRAGTSSTVNVFHRPVGTIRYSKVDKKWYVQGLPTKEYSLQYKVSSPSYRDVAMAMTLHQSIYSTYSRCCGYKASHKFGVNSGGNYNDWDKYHIKP